MTVTKRVTSTAAGGNTQRIAGVISTAVTKRMSAAATAANTKRVATGSHVSSYDCWAGSWGRSWGLSWQNFLSASELSENLTLRVPSGVSGGATKRVTQEWVLLREDGYSLLREDGSQIVRD